MTKPSFRFNVGLKGLERFNDTINQDLRGSGNGPIRKALRQWGYVYRQYLRLRYLRYARGGGNWPPLKPATIRRRRGRGNKVSILIDSGTMIGAFQPAFAGKPGQLQEDVPFGVRVGVGGGEHPHAHISIRELIRIHHFGLGNVPAREIVVPPDDDTTKTMKRLMVVAVKDARHNS